LCEASSDVIAALPQIAAARESSPEDRLMSVLAVDPETVGTIARRADLAIEETLAILLRMEWSGLAAVHPGSRWSKRVASSA
jgi:predicted Rossmann fold nucleotide-binding protein DprA/Smf involved in DNA uptake